MENAIATSWDGMCESAARAADGLHDLEVTLGIKHNTEVLTRANLDGAKTTQAGYQTSKGLRLSAVAQQRAADQQARDFMRTARDAFKPLLGARYSQAWNEVGFINNSLALPKTLAARMGLLDAMHACLVAHPEMEAATLDVTADQAQTLLTQFRTAISAVDKAQSDQKLKRVARDAAAAALRTRLRNLVKELGGLLDPLDGRWRRFGFNAPGDTSTPLPPEGLVVMPGLAQQLLPQWDWTAGAVHYRVFQMVVGVDKDYVCVKVTSDTQAVLNHYVSGSHVWFRVTATNGSGESLPCAPVEAIVP